MTDDGLDQTTDLHLGLIGWPVEHSLSPVIHEAALRAAGRRGAYHLYPLRPEDAQAGLLVQLLKRLRSGELQGLNVTIPYKQRVLAYVDALTPAAAAIGAANTLYRVQDRLVGDNTDAAGFLADLQRLGVAGPSAALVLGAGGAARAVVYALVDQGGSVQIAARRVDQAKDLVADLKRSLPNARLTALALTPRQLGRAVEHCDLVVNATPLGMWPQLERSAWPPGVDFPAGAFVYDLVYNPRETALVRAARAADLRAEGGLGMLVEQAALAFERWTGIRAPRPAMYAAVGKPFENG